MTDLRARFLPSFLVTATRRLARCDELLAEAPKGEALAKELHALQGEAGLLGLDDVLAAVREALVATRAGAFDRAAISVEAIHTAVAGWRPVPVAPVVPAAPAALGRVLLVDDSEMFRSTVAAILEDAGHQVVEAGTLAEARAALAGGKFAAVLLDVHLGDEHGPTLIPDARAHGARVLLLSGEESDSSGADGLLLKTAPPAELLRALEVRG
jgi:CheY-like chemotaxis protein